MNLDRCQLIAGLSAAALLAAAVGCGSQSKADLKPDGEMVAKMRSPDTGAGGGQGADTGTEWGTLKGRFIFNGNAPQTPLATYDSKKDPLCTVHVADETLVVDPSTKGLANVVIFLTKAPRVHPDILNAQPKEAVFDQKECRFLNHVFGVNMRDKFVILNGDSTGHNASGTPGRGNPSFNPLLPAQVGRYEYPGFKKELSTPFTVSCAIHPWMNAYVIPRPDSYFAVTGTDGSFTIENLPAGTELEFQVWHERAPQGLAARPEWVRGRFKQTIPADSKELVLDVQVDASLLQ